MQTIQNRLLSLAALAAIAFAVAGCKTEGYQKGNAAADNIGNAANEIAALNPQIDKTLASLSDLVEKPASDLVPQFKAFSADVDKLKSMAMDVKAAREKMGSSGRAFMAQWDEQLAQIHNEDIKSRSQARKDEVAQRLTAVKASYSEAETAFRPFNADLNDIMKYLSIDLTAGGLNSIKEPVAKAKQDAVPLKQTVSKLADQFKALGVSMSSAAPAQAPK